MLREERKAKMAAVASRRIGHVAAAIEAVHHRHNVSAILRTADALGLHRVHLVQGHFIPVKGAARGAERWLDLHHDPDPQTAIQSLRDAGYAIYVADLSEDSVAPSEVPLDRPVCLWFGAELVGVSPEARAAADGVVTIPMYGFMQSLNVSVAAAMTLSTVASRARSELGPAALLSEVEREALLARWVDREEAVRDAALHR